MTNLDQTIVQLQARLSINEQERSSNQFASTRVQISTEERPGLAAQQSVKDSAPPKRSNSDQPTEKERLEAYLCANQLMQIGLEGDLWADLHQNQTPASFLELKEYLAPMMLVCPSLAIPDCTTYTWITFNPACISYKLPSTGFNEVINWRPGSGFTFARCPFHGTQVLNSQRGAVMPEKYSRHDGR
jgi:hypothetical protein